MRGKKLWLTLFFVFVFGYVLRVMFLSQGSLTFGYDQARDAYQAQSILTDLKVLGPPASTPGLYHGVFYYYFLAIPYLFGKSPILAAYFVALFNAATVFTVFALTYLFTKRKGAALIASFLFAVSFESAQYATWLSNPTLGVWTVPLIYLGLWLWLSKTPKQIGTRFGPVVCALGLGLSIQSEIFLVYHAVPLVLWLLIARRNVTRRDLIRFLVVLVLSLSTMIVSEVKFGFKGMAGVKNLAITSQPSLAYADSLGDYLMLYLNQIGRIFAFNSYPGNVGYGGGLVLVLAIALFFEGKSKKLSWQLFLASWLFSHLTVVTVGGKSTPFLMVGIGPAVSILLGIYLDRWLKRGKLIGFLVLSLIVFGNLSLILRENPQGSTLFAIQKDMTLAKQRKAIDFTYKQANGEPFSINTLTSPLWINLVWTYLYEWYGMETYGYLPQFHGRDQVGLLASLPKVEEETQNYFLIIEPLGGIPEKYLPLSLGEEDSKSEFVGETYFGELRVQQRKKR